MSEKPAIRVYYNSACPVCNAGITAQRRKMAGCDVQWRDIHNEAEACAEIGAEREFVRKRLHAVDENGQVKIGIEAFITLWRHSPGERWKGHLFSLPGVKHLAMGAYNAFAWLLYKWNRWMRHW